MVVKILLDSNIIIMATKGLITYSMFEEVIEQKIEFITTSAVIDELERLSNEGPRSLSRVIKFSFNLIKKLNVKVLQSEVKGADDSIFYLAIQLKNSGDDVYVATCDRVLRRRLRSVGIPSIYYRESKAGLEAEWYSRI
ncbi:MAG: hypothetical protein G5Z42_03605 [Caldisphaeraceae archaeon]|nr:hypothetical protein [Caldisphaeraceae archaeon]